MDLPPYWPAVIRFSTRRPPAMVDIMTTGTYPESSMAAVNR